MWLAQWTHPHSPAYNIPIRVRLPGTLDPGLLRRCFADVLSRHDALRTRFEERDGSPFQIVDGPALLPVDVLDLRGRSPVEQRRAARSAMEADARQPFALDRAPLVRVLLVMLGEHSLLYVNVHHLVCDGWAAGVLSGELCTLYAAFARGDRSPFAPPEVRYADHARQECARFAAGMLDGQIAEWRRQLDGLLPATPLHPDQPRPTQRRLRGAKYPLTIPSRLTSAVRSMARREQTTLFAALLAALTVVLYRRSGDERVVIGATRSNREGAAVERVIGHFVTVVALRLHPSAELSLGTLLAHAHDVSLAAFDRSSVPLERVLTAMRLPAEARRIPPVGVVLTLQNARLPLPDDVVGYEQVDNGTAKFDLVVNLLDLDTCLRGWLEYDTDLFSPATVARIADHLGDVLGAMVTDPRTCLVDVRLSGARPRTAGHPPTEAPPSFRFDPTDAVDV
jgi:hypothetical protein